MNGLAIHYREAGPGDGPALLLLHGFPSSGRMFDTLIPLLADQYLYRRAMMIGPTRNQGTFLTHIS